MNDDAQTFDTKRRRQRGEWVLDAIRLGAARLGICVGRLWHRWARFYTGKDMLRIRLGPPAVTAIVRYAIAVGTVMVALLLQMLVRTEVGQTTPVLLFFSAIMVSAWHGGVGPGILATFLSVLINDYFFVDLGHSFFGHTMAHHLRLGLFVVQGLLISGLCEAMHVAIRRAEASRQEAQRAQDDRTRLLAREQEARAQAETANQIKDEFLATISHELRTPLNAMLGWAQMLRTGKLDESGHSRALEIIEHSAKSQAQLIDDLLDLSRIMSGKMRLDLRPVQLPKVIEAAIETVRPVAEAKGVALRCMLEPLPAVVLGDSSRLQQIIWNLLSNALKFTPGGGAVQVGLRQHVDSSVEISVRDTGIGIRPGFLPYVFEPFHQGDASGKRAQGGLGLGLAIVRHLIELHGGNVRAESEGEGKGTTIRVRLPIAAIQTRLRSRGAQQITTKPQLLEPLPQLAGVSVLVVEDDAPSREMITAMLSIFGVEVTAVGSAAEGLCSVQQLRPDVLLSDIQMPDEDGYSLIRKIRALADDQGGRTPAVALTAYSRAEDRARALAAGYQQHIAKPADPAELAETIAKLARRSVTV